MTLNRRIPMPRGDGLKRNPENPLKRGGGLRRTPFHRKAAPKAKAARRDTIPPRVRRTVAEAQGLVVPRGTLLPGSVHVLLHGGAVAWLTCDGKRVTAEPGQVAA